MTDEEYKKLDKLVHDTAKTLGEQFDSVLILTSALDGDHTQNFSAKSGNQNAVNGHANDYVIRCDEEVRYRMRKLLEDKDDN